VFHFIRNEVLCLFHNSRAAHLECKDAAIALGLGHGRLNFIEMFNWDVPRQLVYSHKTKLSPPKSVLLRLLSPCLGLPNSMQVAYRTVHKAVVSWEDI